MGELSMAGSIALYLFSFGTPALIVAKKRRNLLKKFLLVIFLPILLAAFRYKVGYDYGSYIFNYNLSKNANYADIFHSFSMGASVAFSLLTKFAASFGSDRIYLMILALAAITPAMIYILRDWDNPETLPMTVFIFLIDQYMFAFSACRQGVALSILMVSLGYIYDRKFVKFCLCVFLATLVHPTAMAFFPVYFFVDARESISPGRRVLIIAACLFAIFNLGFILGGISDVLDVEYQGYATEIVEGRNLSFVQYSVIALVLIFFRKKLISLDNRNELLIIMMIVGALCQILGFRNAFAKRIGSYFLLAEPFIIPQLQYVFIPKNRRFLRICMVIYYFAMFYFGGQRALSGMGFFPYAYKFFG